MQETQIFTEKGVILDKKDGGYFVKVLSGPDGGRVVKAEGQGSSFKVLEKNFSQGDKISLYVEKNPEEHLENYSIKGFWHLDSLIVWFFIFCGTVLLVGGKQGFRSLFSLLGSVLIILFLFIPGIKMGFEPVILSGVIAFFVTLFTILLIVGNTKKGWIAIGGTFLGVVISYIFAFLIAKTSGIDGLGSEAFRSFAITSPGFDYTGIFFAGIIIGALGAVMDTTISIASGLNELKEKVPNIGFKGLLSSGMTMGGDIMGGMINTLVFAYLGTSIIVVLSASINGIGVVEFLNFPFISEEILRSIAGTTGLLLSIPFTAFLGAWILGKNK